MPDIIEIKEGTRHCVMAKLSPGKQYLTSVDSVSQEPQKGPTCWFYAYNMLRLRLGKDFDDEYNILVKKLAELQKTDPNTAKYYFNQILYSLKKLREDEKAVSAYRKMLTYCHELEGYRIAFCGGSDKEPPIDKHINPNYIKSTVGKDLIKYLNDYRKQKTIGSFKTFIASKIAEIKKARFIKFYQSLGYKEPQQLIDILEAKYPAHETPKRCVELVRAQSAELLGLKESQWKSSGNIDQLVATIRQEGAIVVNGREGVGYYKEGSAAEEQDINIPYKIYSLSASQRKDAKSITNGHAIVIIGAEKGINQNTGLDYVYYVDPNDGSKPGQSKAVYKITFEQFKATANTNVCYYSDAKEKEKLISGYQEIKLKLNDQSITIPQQQAKASQSNIIYSNLLALAKGIGVWTLAGLIGAVALANVTMLSFIALPVCMIIGTALTMRSIVNNSKKLMLEGLKHSISSGKLSTTLIAHQAKFDKLPDHDSKCIGAPALSNKTHTSVSPQLGVVADTTLPVKAIGRRLSLP